jgi:hypothetical protein
MRNEFSQEWQMVMKRVTFTVVLLAFLCLNALPAMADMYDLTGSSTDMVFIDGAWFYNVNAASTGSGVIQSFVRIQTNAAVEQGYNTDYRPLQFDENNSSSFTHSLLLSDVPTVDLGGTLYREFLLDINQNKTGDGRLLSLDALQIYQADVGDLHGYPTGWGTPVYNLDASTDNYILLDYSLNNGSGSGDMFAYIPDSAFSDSLDYVYLYSMFGVENPNTASYEEWAVRTDVTSPPPPPPVPVPAAVILGLLGLGIAGLKLRRYA